VKLNLGILIFVALYVMTLVDNSHSTLYLPYLLQGLSAGGGAAELSKKLLRAVLASTLSPF